MRSRAAPRAGTFALKVLAHIGEILRYPPYYTFIPDRSIPFGGSFLASGLIHRGRFS